MSTELDFAAIADRLMQRAGGAVDDPPPNDRPAANADRLARRARAMAANGFERRALDLVRSPSYDESRAAGYLDALRSLDGNRHGGIVVLAGNPGSGKTAAVCRWAYTRAESAPRFLRAAEFFRSSRYAGREEPGVETRGQLMSKPVLVLDDVGAEFADASGSYRVDLDELVDRFYADARILVITTNLVYATARQRDAARGDADAPTFADRYGERVTDRLRECGRWVSSGAASMRRSAP